MRQLARSSMLFVALVACTPNSQTAAERRAAAARADSSAAGYDVAVIEPRGPAVDTTQAMRTPNATDSARPSGPGAVPPPPAGGVVPVAVVTPPRTTTQQPARRPPVATDTGTRSRDTVKRGLPPLDPALEAMFLTFDEGKKTATFQLAAGNELLDQVSFNGVTRGERVLTVPVGWRVGIEFSNRDTYLPHSALVTEMIDPVPEQLPLAAFPGAQSVKADAGLLEGDSDEIVFVADRPGRYLIACGVLSHAQRGQWLLLEISATATVPTYR